jgi:hypothetical protein
VAKLPRQQKAQLFARAVDHHQKGQLKEAVAVYERLLFLDDGLAEVHINLASPSRRWARSIVR